MNVTQFVWNDLLKNKKVRNYWNNFVISILFLQGFLLSWLESRTSGINQRVRPVPAIRDSSPDWGAKGSEIFQSLFYFILDIFLQWYASE
jgi:hypothetical protein